MVFKDASATAVYDVRGANGVILVTTRRSETGKEQVPPSVQYSLQQFTNTPLRLNSWEYVRLINEAAANDGISPIFSDY